MKHDLLRLLCAPILIAALLLPSAAAAGEVEVEVINAATNALFEEDDWTTVEPETWAFWVADALDIYGDTVAGSDCATYAALTVSYLDNVATGFLNLGQRNYQLDTAITTYHLFDTYQHLCLMEELF